MSFSRTAISIFVLVLLGLIAFVRIIHLCDSLRKRNSVRKLGLYSIRSYVGIGLSGFIIFALIVAAWVDEKLFIVCARSASVTLEIAEILGTLQTLDKSNSWWFYATGLCSAVNLIFLFLLPVLALTGHIDRDRIAQWKLNMAALPLMAAVSIGSALWLCGSQPFLWKLPNGHWKIPRDTNEQKKLLAWLCVWCMSSSLAFGGIASVVLTVLSIRSESTYQTVVLAIFCARSVLAIRFIPFGWILKIMSRGSRDSSPASQVALYSPSVGSTGGGMDGCNLKYTNSISRSSSIENPTMPEGEV